MGEECRCTNERCATQFPIVDGVPVLISEKTSVFTFADFTEKRKTFFDPNANGRSVRERIARLLYENSSDLKAPSALSTFARLVSTPSAMARVLIIGAGTNSEALAPLHTTASIELVATDVSLNENVSIICDGHDLPFDDETFDGVIAQGVLEHVVDPYRCVDEMHRVLRRDGIVFSETPFIQQVHGGRYDFTRFTHLGHRRLFRRFEEIESGASAGPGLALSWSYQYFLISFVSSKTLKRAMRVFGKLTSFWWKYFDPYLIDRPGALDAASALYFLGRKSDTVFSDRQLVDSYRGANQR
jgi:SAM-dependent methyltransferase